jgi:Na+-driven multidrug efflux pump
MVQAIVMPKDAFLHTSYFTIRAGGKTIITFLFDSVFMLAVSVPVAYVLSRFTTLDAAIVFALVHAADLIKCLIGYILLKKNVWMNNIVNE